MRTLLSPRTLAVVVGAWFAAPAAAEVPKPPELKSADRNLVLKMRNGEIRSRGPDVTATERGERLAALKKVAQNYVFSVANPPLNGETDASGKGPYNSLPVLIGDVEQSTNLVGPSSNSGKLTVEQLDYAEEFGAAVAEAVKVVLEQSARPIERVNAVRILAITARMPAPAVIEPFLVLIQNTQASDALKLYAFQGLRNLLEQSRVDFPAQHIFKPTEAAARLGQIHDVLAGYVFQKRTVRDDKEAAVIQFVRRDAVAALARFKDAVLRKSDASKTLIARPSWSLLRVIAGDPSVAPGFTIQELAEATIGLGMMKPDPDMNLDVAAAAVAQGLTYYVTAANEDGVRSAAEGGPQPLLPWKVQSARLAVALATWREATKPLGAGKGAPVVADLAVKALPVLAPIEQQGAAKAQTNIQPLTDWLAANPPKAWADGTAQPGTPIPVYRDDPGPKLPFPAPPMPAPMLKTPDGAVPPAKKGTEAVPPAKKGTEAVPPAKKM